MHLSYTRHRNVLARTPHHLGFHRRSPTTEPYDHGAPGELDDTRLVRVATGEVAPAQDTLAEGGLDRLDLRWSHGTQSAWRYRQLSAICFRHGLDPATAPDRRRCDQRRTQGAVRTPRRPAPDAAHPDRRWRTARGLPLPAPRGDRAPHRPRP